MPIMLTSWPNYIRFVSFSYIRFMLYIALVSLLNAHWTYCTIPVMSKCRILSVLFCVNFRYIQTVSLHVMYCSIGFFTVQLRILLGKIWQHCNTGSKPETIKQYSLLVHNKK